MVRTEVRTIENYSVRCLCRAFVGGANPFGNDTQEVTTHSFACISVPLRDERAFVGIVFCA